MVSASFGIATIGYIGWGHQQSKQLALADELGKYREMLGDLVDLIIPPTDSIGAKDAGVHHYVMLMVKDAISGKEQRNFMNGLEDLRTYCHDYFAVPYEQCSLEEKSKALRYFSQKGIQTGLMGKVRTKIFGKPFFRMLKELTVEGYCTSEQGATGLLAYEYIPGRYNAVTTMNKNTKTWATK